MPIKLPPPPARSSDDEESPIGFDLGSASSAGRSKGHSGMDWIECVPFAIRWLISNLIIAAAAYYIMRTLRLVE